MRPRLRWTAGVIFGLGLALALAAGLAHAQKPIITTPTPTPIWSPTPEGADGFARPWQFGAPSPLATPSMDWLSDEPLEVNSDAFTYTVGISDTLWSLAVEFGRDLDTMSCVTRPTGEDAATLVPGKTVVIPALRDLCYTVTPGDTLSGIAARFGLDVQTIIDVPWNRLSGPFALIQPRQRILLPGARAAAPIVVDRRTVSTPADDWAHTPWPDWPYGDGHFIWPVVGPISQGFHAGHRAIDIAVDRGTPVRAADRGTVEMAGWSSTGYGFRVVIDHHIDYITLYAHLSDIFVRQGQVVAKGQIIGLSGANGNITGPHLHFEIRDFGILTDPLELLPTE